MNKSAFQRGETAVVKRSQLKEALYNPRIIDDSALKRLQKGIKTHGLIGPSIVWNSRTGTVVSGHQRLKALDVLEKGSDYELSVTVIDVDETEEKQINVQLNNPSMMGEWDIDKLGAMLEDGLAAADLGFTESDIDIIFGGDDRFSSLFDDDADVRAAKDILDDIKKDRSETTAKLKNEQSGSFFFVVVCESDDDRKQLLKDIGLPISEQYVSSGAVRRLQRAR